MSLYQARFRATNIIVAQVCDNRRAGQLRVRDDTVVKDVKTRPAEKRKDFLSGQQVGDIPQRSGPR